ncbi:DMT family transporter [Runella salmonicolor]|uniref:DMT family transporter n=1 Tax=Runella salmonicolor TaxID=2950278 RepID=A0ABT1FWI4_9BACT|nr:DMT family transporter [Runella salmonicolor]MCP1386127.1 DMT family transporter [Runella salmonicolor]
MSKTYYWLGAAMVFVAAFCFALKGIFIKLAYRYEIDTISLLTLRMGLSFPIYAFFAFRLTAQETNVRFTIKDWLWVAGLGITGYYFSSYFNFLAFNYISAGLERILLFTYPTFVLVINAIFRRKRVTKLQMAALGLTYFGILVAFLQNIEPGQQKNLILGAFWVTLSGLVYAFYLVGGDKIIPKVGSQKFTSYAMLAATIPTVLHCYAVNGLEIWHYPPQVYWIGITMAIVVTVLPTFALAEGIKRVGAGNASIIASIGPIFTIFLATTILDEQITALQIFGTLLVLVGVFLISWKGKK